MYKVRRNAIFLGGSVDLGADVNVYRSAADTLKTDDSFTIAGATFVAPYATTTPTMATNGQIQLYQKGGTPRLVVRLGGTNIIVQFPTATGGTAFYTVGTAAPA